MIETRLQCLKRMRAQWEKVESEQGLLTDILSRLPFSSLRGIQTVNKYWYGSTRNKYFARKQLAQSREKPAFIACPKMARRMKLYSMKPGTFKLYDLKTVDPSGKSEKDMYMISSFNGLICCINHITYETVENKFSDLQIWVCNPSTGESLLLPQGSPSFSFIPSVGVAYDSNSSDYKIFRIFCAGKKTPEEWEATGNIYLQDGQIFTTYRDAVIYKCEVYSSRTGAWKNSGTVPCVPKYFHLSPFKCGHVFVGGKIYWLCSLDDDGKILSVDFEGKFEVIPLPKYAENLKEEDAITEGSYLINLQGTLSIVILHPQSMDIWSLKEDANKCSSWVFLCADYFPFNDYDVVLAMSSLKNHIICVTEKHWRSYDVDTRIWTRKRMSNGAVNPAVYPFTESLVPCKGSMML